MADNVVHQEGDQMLPCFQRLCDRFWGKSDSGRDQIYKHYTIQTPCLGDPTQSSLETYTAIELGPDFEHLFPPDSPRFMLRRDYVELADHVQSQAKPWCGGIVLTGQSGIGKSFFLYYLLIERVLEGKVTAWDDPTMGIYLLLGQNNVVLHPGNAYDLNPGGYPGAWALTDSNEFMQKPHRKLICARSSFFVVQAVSPDAERWRGWRKQRNGPLAVMKPWSWEEIYIGAAKFELNVSIDKLERAFSLCGGSARQCFMFTRNDQIMSEWEEETTRLLRRHPDLSSLAIGLLLSYHRTDPSLSSLIFCIVPQKTRYPAVSLVSAFAAYHVAKALEKQNPANFWRLYKALNREPGALYAAEWLLEALRLGGMDLDGNRTGQSVV